jgi:hypothetical protein
MKLPVIFLLVLTSVGGHVFAQTEVDTFGSLPDDDVYARVEHFGAAVKRIPGSIGHAVIHKAQYQPIGAFLRYIRGIEDLWQRQGNSNATLVIHAGTEKPDLEHHFWIVKGVETFSVDVLSIDERIEKRLVKRTLFDRQCIGCDPAVLLHQWIFREGIDYFGRALKANKGSSAEIIIGRNEFVSGTRKERAKLTQNIRRTLTKYSIPNRRIRIRFVNSMFASFYIMPKKSL